MATGLLPAVGSPGVEPGVALPADHLVAVVPLGQDTQGGLDDSSSQSEHQVEGRLLLDVVVRQGSAVLKLLSSEDQPLLIRRNTLLVLQKSNDFKNLSCHPIGLKESYLDLSLDILNGVTWLHLEGDGFPGEGLHKDLHDARLSFCKP